MAPDLPLSHHRRGTVALVLVLGAAFSLLAWRVVDHQQAERIHTAFLSQAQTQAAVAGKQLGAYTEMVYSLRDSFLGQRSVTRLEFTQVARALLDRHAGVQALEWVQTLPHAQRAEFEQQASRELGRPVAVHRLQADGSLGIAPAADEYWVIAYVEPLAGNERILGYDVRSAPTAPLLAAARADGKFRISQTFQLAQSDGRDAEPGVIFLLPFSRSGQDPVDGFVQGVFRVETMLAQSHGLTSNAALDTYYFDVTAGPAAARLLYANLGGDQPLRRSGSGVGLPPLDDPDDFQHTLEIGGRRWLMLVRKHPAWLAEVTSAQPLLILVGGMTITVLLALFINLLLHRTRRIEQEVEERTRQLRASETRLQDIVDHSPAIIFVKDLEGRYVLVNRAFRRLLQVPASRPEGFTDRDIFPPAMAEAYRQMDQRVMTSGEAAVFEEAVPVPGGEPLTCLTQKFPLRDTDGRTYGVCGMATDITDRKVAEQQRLALERRLLESQKYESLGVLAGGIAHDFNNILTAILGNASLATLQLRDDHPVRPQLRQVENAARRAGDLCAQMLAYAGRGAFLTAPVGLSSLVRGTAALLEVTVGRRARLELDLADGLPAVIGDATQLRQIVMNLVINASDAVGERPGGEIVIRTFRQHLPAERFQQAVQSPPLPAGDYVGLEVRDNGTGMPPEVLARIFEPFFTTKFSGRGLGLAAVLGIVQKHGGALFVESTVGQGTVFQLFLPATNAPAGSSASPFPDRPGPEHLSGTVLLVDDEQPVRQVATRALASLGLEVLEAPDGASALELYRRRGADIDAVLLDLTMPGLSGEETLRQLRALDPAVRVVVMSGFTGGDTMQRCAELGVASYLPKPFELSALVDRLRPHLN